MSFLANKTAIITGAGYAVLSDGRCGSIGYGIATAYAKEGANLVITGRNMKKLEAAKEDLEGKYGIKVLPIAADICAGADNQAGDRDIRQHSGADQLRAGFSLRGSFGRTHDRTV